MLVKQRSESMNASAHSVFVRIDKNRSGTIDKDELVTALQKSKSEILGQMKEEKIGKVLSEVDYNLTGEIEYTEFIAATLDKDVMNDEDTLQGLFNLFDINNDGSIDKEELVQTFSKFGKHITLKEIDTILKEHDLHHTGKIEFDEFKAMLVDDDMD